ncbi:hypothetical protein [Microvirga yunnanensis]|uniref:hypothetical protein n=1 Tax=Microvirga yunnanensis TaxID=2953740 RepID=UPI0021C657E6|nr:hypothetical protein [Microvirga sp. HBU65207]
MTWIEHSARWRRQATALVSALALALHIVFMALGTLGPLAPDGEAAQVHTHHAASTAERDAGGPTKSPEHKPPCCILSVCPGLPGPPIDHILTYLPRREAHAAVYGTRRPMAGARIPQLPPVGARAPPALA